jgi:WD40 repeat protein
MVLPVDERGLRVVDTATWKDAFTLRAHADMIASVAWSPDGKRLASLSHVGTKAHVVLWNTSTGLEAWAFSYPITKFSGPRLMWSSDGRRLTCETIKGSYSWDAPISTDGPLAQEPIRTVMPAKK